MLLTVGLFTVFYIPLTGNNEIAVFVFLQFGQCGALFHHLT